MAQKDNTRFARMALNLKMIDVGQFNEVMDIWEKDPTKDTGLILCDKGFIAEEQYQSIFSMFTDHKSTLQNFEVDDTKVFLGGEKKEGEESDYTEDFTLRGILGQGGIGRVYIGVDKNIKREVAIKELLPEEAKEQDRNLTRFVREARVTGQLEHPGIIPIYQLDTKSDGSVFYVMKYVRGKTLFEAIRDCEEGAPEESFKKRIPLLGNLIGTCDAMGYAHSKGVIHRDLKPSNIILGEFGETIVIDWGLAKVSMEADSTPPSKDGSLQIKDGLDPALTRYGEFLGTPSYMAPEQIESKYGRIDARTDVFTLGIILFMILTGKKPFPGKGKEAMNAIIGDEPVPSPRSYGELIPPELAAICEKALSRDKKKRFGNAFEMSAELKAYRDGRLVSVYTYSKKELFRKFIARNKVALIAAVAVILSIVVGAGFSINFGIDAHRARVRADKALIDVSNLSEAAIKLSRYSAVELTSYFSTKVKKAGDLESMKMEKVIPEALSFDPLKSRYQVWCMDGEGHIIYDEDPAQIGKFLFTDSMYARFPELLRFGDRMRAEPWGVGHYQFMEKSGQGPEVYKIAAWDTFSPIKGTNWKIVVTYPYTTK